MEKEDGHFIDDPVVVVNTRPSFSGIGLNRTLSDEEIERMVDETFETVKEILRKNAWAGMFPSEDGKCEQFKEDKNGKDI